MKTEASTLRFQALYRGKTWRDTDTSLSGTFMEDIRVLDVPEIPIGVVANRLADVWSAKPERKTLPTSSPGIVLCIESAWYPVSPSRVHLKAIWSEQSSIGRALDHRSFRIQVSDPLAVVDDLKITFAPYLMRDLEWRRYHENVVDAAELEAVAEFVNRDKVTDFLVKNASLVSYVKEGIALLQRAFGDGSRFQLMLVEDPDGGPATLLANVLTTDATREAIEKIRAFDRRWYSGLPKHIRISLTFDVSPQ